MNTVSTFQLAVSMFLTLGFLLEIFWGRRWRRPFQRIFAGFTYLSGLGLALKLFAEGAGPFLAIAAGLTFYEGAERLWIITEIGSGLVRGWSGTNLVIELDERHGLVLAPRPNPVDGRPPLRGEHVNVTVESSWLFGWRIGAKIEP